MTDSIKPVDYTNFDLNELTYVIASTSLILPEFNREKDSLFEVLKKNVTTLKERDRLQSYFILMLYNFNHHYSQFNETQ
ncbi:hypothetical protein [Galbibacter sp. PAP.153]|uniref:hypothetical protein n=1 Tax=Galbibacter sp. PAP.153 TaxID=3104623 RepID=UPI00300853E6